jgi:hypothetical protein
MAEITPEQLKADLNEYMTKAGLFGLDNMHPNDIVALRDFDVSELIKCRKKEAAYALVDKFGANYPGATFDAIGKLASRIGFYGDTARDVQMLFDLSIGDLVAVEDYEVDFDEDYEEKAYTTHRFTFGILTNKPTIEVMHFDHGCGDVDSAQIYINLRNEVNYNFLVNDTPVASSYGHINDIKLNLKNQGKQIFDDRDLELRTKAFDVLPGKRVIAFGDLAVQSVFEHAKNKSHGGEAWDFLGDFIRSKSKDNN